MVASVKFNCILKTYFFLVTAHTSNRKSSQYEPNEALNNFMQKPTNFYIEFNNIGVKTNPNMLCPSFHLFTLPFLCKLLRSEPEIFLQKL